MRLEQTISVKHIGNSARCLRGKCLRFVNSEERRRSCILVFLVCCMFQTTRLEMIAARRQL